MESDLLALHWMEHSSVFSQAIGNLRTKTSYTDATLACEGHFYPVHKFVLSTCSKYFNAIFEWTPCINPVVVINNVTYKVLEALLDFMYIGEVSVKDSVIPDVMRAAECLKIRGLSIPDDDAVKPSVKNKSKTDSGEPSQKRRRTTVPKKRPQTPVPNSIPSISQPMEFKSSVAVSPPASTPTPYYDNEENFNHDENQAPDLTPIQESQRHLPESQNYDADAELAHTSLHSNVPSTYVQPQLSPSPLPLVPVHPLQPMQPSNTIISYHNKIFPSHFPTPSHSSALDQSSQSHEQIYDVPVHSAVDIIKSNRLELVETKPHVSQVIMSPEEMPDLDPLDGVQSQYDTNPELGEEDSTFHAAEPNENLYEFTEDLPSASTALPPPPPPHQDVHYPKGPAACSSSEKVDQNSTEDKPAFKCTSCGKEFRKKDGLSRHMRIHNKGLYTCKQCPFTSKTYKDCQEHKKKEHAILHKCPDCEYTTTRSDQLKRHLATHKKPHQCLECKFSSANLQNLQKHVKNKHEKK